LDPRQRGGRGVPQVAKFLLRKRRKEGRQVIGTGGAGSEKRRQRIFEDLGRKGKKDYLSQDKSAAKRKERERKKTADLSSTCREEKGCGKHERKKKKKMLMPPG